MTDRFLRDTGEFVSLTSSAGVVNSVGGLTGTISIGSGLNTTGGTLNGSSSYFNVKHYGALGDNSHDDQSAIQTALNSCSAVNGGTVFFPTGVYKVGSRIEVPANVFLLGTGPGSSQIATSGDTTAVFFGGNYAGIEKISCNASLTSSASAACILTDTISNLTMRDCIFSGGLWGLQNKSNDSILENCLISGYSTAGGHLYSNDSASWYRRCRFNANGVTTTKYGAYLDATSTQESYFDMCDFSDTPSGGTVVTIDDGATNSAITGFTNCVFGDTVKIHAARASMFTACEIDSMTIDDSSAVNVVGCYGFTSISITGTGVVKAGNTNIT